MLVSCLFTSCTTPAEINLNLPGISAHVKDWDVTATVFGSVHGSAAQPSPASDSQASSNQHQVDEAIGKLEGTSKQLQNVFAHVKHDHRGK